MAREQVTTVPRRQAGGAHVASAPAAGRGSDPSASARLRRRARKRVIGMARPCSHNTARPHLQLCNRGVDGPGAGDDGPPAAGGGGTCLRTSCRASEPSKYTRTCKAVPTRTHQVAQTFVQARAPKFLARSLLSQARARSCTVTAVATLGRQRCFHSRKRPLSCNNLSNILYCQKL